MNCPIGECGAPTLEVGRYAGLLCLDHALTAAGAKPRARVESRAEALRAHERLHQAFKARNRHLTDLGPVRGAQGPSRATLEKSDPTLLAAIATVMTQLEASIVHIGPRYGTLPPGERPIALGDDPRLPCAQCGTTSTRIARAPYGVGGDTVWILCNAADACMARARKAKAA